MDTGENSKAFRSAVLITRHISLNLIFSGLFLCLIDHYLIYPLAVKGVISNVESATAIFLPKLILLPWFGRKTIQFAESHYHDYGNRTIKTGLFSLLVVWVLVLSVCAINAIQSILFTEKTNQELSEVFVPQYQLSVDPDGAYRIEGLIDFGISRDMKALVQNHPGGNKVILKSTGGSIYEGRGLAKFFQSNRLITQVNSECSSACTLAFIGGEHRIISATARLGFHQYTIDYAHLNQSIPFYDPKEEQKTDANHMRQKGISDEFIDRIFTASSDSIWYPSQAELLEAGVIHAVFVSDQ